MLLSKRSATADENEYPKDLIDSISAGAKGTHSLSNIFVPPTSLK